MRPGKPPQSKHKSLINPKKAARESDDGSDDENNLITKDGRKLTVAEFLADVELLKAKKQPLNMAIGIHNTEYQRY